MHVHVHVYLFDTVLIYLSYRTCSDIFDAMFTSKANAGDVIIQQGKLAMCSAIYMYNI